MNAFDFTFLDVTDVQTVKNSNALHRTFNVDPLYLKHENSGLAIDYMHWQIPLSKRFRALKLWFVIRSFGISGLQKHIRESVRMAQKFEALVLADPRFEIAAPRHLGLVCLRLRGDNHLTEKLLKRVNSRGNIHCVPAALKNDYVIRFTITSQRTTVDDITKDWAELRRTATEIMESEDASTTGARQKVRLADTRERNENFGSSLLLANSPMSPKIVNGSFAAIFDAEDFILKCSRPFSKLRLLPKDSPEMRRRVKGILMSGKQFSLDSRMDLVSSALENINSRMASSDLLKEESVDYSEDYESEEVELPTSSDAQARRLRSHSVPHGDAEDDVPKVCHKCGHLISN